MASNKTITINGRLYDALTGLPVAGGAASSTPTQQPAAQNVVEKATARPSTSASAAAASSAVHSTVQRSKTLHRRAAKKPVLAAKPLVRRPSAGRVMDMGKSPSVSKYAPHPVTTAAATTSQGAKVAVTQKPATRPNVDTPAQAHPAAKRALQRTAAAKAVATSRPLTAKEVKDTNIDRALAASKTEEVKKPLISPKNKWLRRFILVGSLAVVIVGTLYTVYQFVPSVSVGIASAQAGVNAKYPEYVPDGYRLDQPVRFEDGRVILAFSSNSNDTSYTITQTRSSWDSSAVLDNVVQPKAGGNYTTTKERGLTIYTFNNDAAWVNGGILYTIDSDASLSGDQVRRIATSL